MLLVRNVGLMVMVTCPTPATPLYIPRPGPQGNDSALISPISCRRFKASTPVWLASAPAYYTSYPGAAPRVHKLEAGGLASLTDREPSPHHPGPRNTISGHEGGCSRPTRTRLPATQTSSSPPTRFCFLLASHQPETQRCLCPVQGTSNHCGVLPPRRATKK